MICRRLPCRRLSGMGCNAWHAGFVLEHLLTFPCLCVLNNDPAAAIVMRAVRNTVDTGRTVVCTIHQPSIHIFDSFDELLLLKRGGRTIYHGPTGAQSVTLIDYFTSALAAVEPPQNELNPATWMLDISAVGAEARYQVDWAEVYANSDLRRWVWGLVHCTIGAA